MRTVKRKGIAPVSGILEFVLEHDAEFAAPAEARREGLNLGASVSRGKRHSKGVHQPLGHGEDILSAIVVLSTGSSLSRSLLGPFLLLRFDKLLECNTLLCSLPSVL